MIDTPITIQLDRKRPVRWTKRAEARNASLPRPASFVQLGNRRRGSYVLMALIWSSLVERDHEFEAPEDLAEYLSSEEQQLAALKVINALIDDAFPEKKTGGNESFSANGQTPSSNADSAPQAQAGGT